MLRRMLEAAVNKLDEVGEKSHAKDVAKLTPAQREVYEAWEARGAAARAGVPASDLPDPRLTGRVLRGPAGEASVGIAKAPKVQALDDPAAWEEQRRRELADRDAARAPYLAPDRRPVEFTRIATKGGSQLADVAVHLAEMGLADRPDLVYGVARVPDLISPTSMRGEKRGLVEWEIAHAVTTPLPPCPPPATFSLAAKEVWVARRPGEPSVLDEDLALDVLVRADIGPQAVLGIAREVAIEKSGGGDEDSTSQIRPRVRGVQLLVRAAARPAVEAALAAPRPWALRDGSPDGTVVEVLQWDAIARMVHPVRLQRPTVPSPFPYLPLTARELLRSYLEIVGLDPADCLSAQVTHHHAIDFMDRSAPGGFITVRTNMGGHDQPCADGKPRKRMAGGHHVVVAYRDRPAYAEGRVRFDAYCDAVLQADLRRGLDLRAPVPKPTGKLEKTLNAVGEVYEFFSGEEGYDSADFRPRYCWPPTR
jgi:hypothetical protein